MNLQHMDYLRADGIKYSMTFEAFFFSKSFIRFKPSFILVWVLWAKLHVNANDTILDAFIPSLTTSTLVQSITVGIRCAIVMIVLSLNSVLTVFWMTASVALSIDAVASSRIKMRLRRRRARPKQSSCLWPMLQFDPPSTTKQIKEMRYKNETVYTQPLLLINYFIKLTFS